LVLTGRIFGEYPGSAVDPVHGGGFSRNGSLPGLPVDGLAEEVCVSVVVGVFLDHGGVDETRAHLGVALRVGEGLVQRVPEGRVAGGFDLAGIGARSDSASAVATSNSAFMPSSLQYR
jgi:hypothetical protein